MTEVLEVATVQIQVVEQGQPERLVSPVDILRDGEELAELSEGAIIQRVEEHLDRPEGSFRDMQVHRSEAGDITIHPAPVYG